MSCHSWLHSYDFISSEYIDSGIAASTHRDRPKRNMDNWIIQVLAGPNSTTKKTDSTTKKQTFVFSVVEFVFRGKVFCWSSSDGLFGSHR